MSNEILRTMDCLRRQRAGAAAWLIAAVAAWAPETVLADAWEFHPILSVRTGYDDNLPLRADEEDGYETTGAAAVALGRVTETSSIGGHLRAEYVDHVGIDNFEAEDNQFVALFGQYSPNELSRVGLDMQLMRDYTGASQRVDSGDDVGEGEIDPDEGLTTQQFRRETMQLAPYWQRMITEKTDIQLAYGYRAQTYSDSGVDAGLTEYEMQSPSMQLGHELNERDRLSLSLQFSRYEPTDVDFESDSYALRAGYTRSITETTSIRFAAGARYVESTAADGSDESDTGGLFHVEARRELETGDIVAMAERTISPSGAGRLIQQDVISLIWKRPLSPRLTFNLRTRYISNNSSDSVESPGTEREFLNLVPGLNYKLTEYWTLGVSYRYRWQDRNDTDADAHGAFLTISYKPKSEQQEWIRPESSRRRY